MKRATFLVIPVLLFLFTTPTPSRAQRLGLLEVGGGWTYITSNFGQNGVNATADYEFTPRVYGVASFDSAWNTSNLGNFVLTPIGQIAIKSHSYNYLFGPRIILKHQKIKKYELNPFVDIQIGGTYLHSAVEQPTTGLRETASDNGFSWLLGGGADYVLSNHWAARADLGFLRSHLANAGHSQLRLSIGVVYSFQTRTR
jgi:opacity protein-like surface antigen